MGKRRKQNQQFVEGIFGSGTGSGDLIRTEQCGINPNPPGLSTRRNSYLLSGVDDGCGEERVKGERGTTGLSDWTCRAEQLTHCRPLYCVSSSS